MELAATNLLSKLHLISVREEAVQYGIRIELWPQYDESMPRLWFVDHSSNVVIGGVGLDHGALALVSASCADHNLWKTMRAMVQGAFTQAREVKIPVASWGQAETAALAAKGAPDKIIHKAPLGHPPPPVAYVEPVEKILWSDGTLTPPGEYWDVLPADKMEKLPTVVLMHAGALFQPVHGSDPTSRYFLVAGYSELKLAARWVNGTMSFRVEGVALQAPAMRAIFTDMGFSKVAESGCSVHLAVNCDLVARQTLASVMAGVPHCWRTPPVSPYSIISVIRGKGS